MGDDKNWKGYIQQLKEAERQLKQAEESLAEISCKSVLDFDHDTRGLSAASLNGAKLPLDCVRWIVSAKSLGPPFGLDILNPFEPPKLPEVPRVPRMPGVVGSAVSSSEAGRRLERAISELERAISAKRNEIRTFIDQDRQRLEQFRRDHDAGERHAIELLAKVTLQRHFLERFLRGPCEVWYDPENQVILCEIAIPSFENLSIEKEDSDRLVSETDRRRACEKLVYSLCIRTAYLVAQTDTPNHFNIVAVNVRQQWRDPATGQIKEGIIASLQAMKADLLQLQPGHFDPKACFYHLRGIITPSIDEMTPIQPIFVMNNLDRRVVASRDVDADLDAGTNIAMMPWEDFEHLVRQLFEWEFGQNGVEVKVTRASRDRGVDAILFDPDPLRGGKFIIQAKRYTRTVDVAAVRELYGTVMNEGANRGILVTTSSYGPDAYEFAKDKPISLVDGRNLLTMLQKHGRNFRIDIVEARKFAEHESG